jgi:hypothetical protein
MATCPVCGSDRLKSAPVAVIGPLLTLISGRRRYRCADCRWTGWKHRLRRRSDATASGVQLPQSASTNAIWFFLMVVGIIVTTSAMLLNGCQGAEGRMRGRGNGADLRFVQTVEAAVAR